MFYDDHRDSREEKLQESRVGVGAMYRRIKSEKFLAQVHFPRNMVSRWTVTIRLLPRRATAVSAAMFLRSR